eukprot:4807044-Prymnesium_polylepis.1
MGDREGQRGVAAQRPKPLTARTFSHSLQPASLPRACSRGAGGSGAASARPPQPLHFRPAHHLPSGAYQTSNRPGDECNMLNT